MKIFEALDGHLKQHMEQKYGLLYMTYTEEDFRKLADILSETELGFGATLSGKLDKNSRMLLDIIRRSNYNTIEVLLWIDSAIKGEQRYPTTFPDKVRSLLCNVLLVDVPLYINDNEEVVCCIARWRLEIGR